MNMPEKATVDDVFGTIQEELVAITTGPQVWLAPLLYARARRAAC